MYIIIIANLITVLLTRTYTLSFRISSGPGYYSYINSNHTTGSFSFGDLNVPSNNNDISYGTSDSEKKVKISCK